MHKEIVINSSPNEVRVALLEDHEVVEFMMERADHKRAVGNVYKGVVTAVRPGLQAAFVDIGMEKGGFLHVSDLVHDDPGDDDDRGRGRGRGRGRRREGLRPIETMLKEGDEILVQVTKEVIGTKGPRLTADISLPGRFMVLMPKGDHVGVSRKIDDRKERGRLKGILSDLKPDDEAGAFIIRTAAIGQDAKMIERDMQYLRDLWKEINQRAHGSQAPAVAHEDVGLIVSLIRDIFKDDIDSVVVDSKDDYQQLMQYVKTFSPDLRERIRLYEGEMPIFDKFGVESELKKSLDKKVWMKRGGFLVIEQTEALVAIDVNTGRFIGKKNQAETIFKTNMVAAKEIARQLRLRDVGGIIVLDFIDMDSEDDKKRVLAELRQHLKRDRSRTKTFAVSELGLIEMSRQRVQESLKDRLSDNCPYCNGSGQVLSVDTLSNKVERLLAKLAVTRNEKAVQVRANPTLALQLMSERANDIQQLERNTGIKIDVVDDARLHREEFQIVSLSRRKDLVAEIEKVDKDGRTTGTEERRGRGEVQRSRRRVAAEGGREDEAERPSRRRRRSRDDEGGSQDRPRRSRSGDDSGRSAEAAPERGRGSQSEGEDSTRSRRRRRRRRSDDDAPSTERQESSRSRRDDAAAQESAPADAGASSAPEGDRSSSDDEDKPRRRRRRGRRGGRGRRRPSRGDEAANQQASSGSEAATQDDAPRAERRSGSEAETAPAPKTEAAPAPKAEAREEKRPDDRESRNRGRENGRRESNDEAAAAPAASGSSDAPEDTGDERPRRRRRRSGDREDRDDSPRHRSRRSRERDRDADEVAAEGSSGGTGTIDALEDYVHPVPESESPPSDERRAEAERQEERDRPGPVPSSSQDDDADADDPDESASGGDDDPRSRRRRRRRRARAAGTPTRMIGTGKTLDKKD